MFSVVHFLASISLLGKKKVFKYLLFSCREPRAGVDSVPPNRAFKGEIVLLR